MAAARQGLPVRLDRAPQRGAAFALTRASRRARTRSIGSRSRARGLSLIFDHPPPSLLCDEVAPSHAKLPVEDKAYQRAALCVTAKSARQMTLWVINGPSGKSHMIGHVRFAPKATVGDQTVILAAPPLPVMTSIVSLFVGSNLNNAPYLCACSWRLAWRLVLAARCRPAAQRWARRFYADANRSR